MELNRKPTQKELNLIKLLIKKSLLDFGENWENDLLVCPMDDGKMGSLSLIPKNSKTKDRVFGKQISEFQFIDTDGVEVLASLYLDNYNDLYEIDIWKADFSSLIELPDLSE